MARGRRLPLQRYAIVLVPIIVEVKTDSQVFKEAAVGERMCRAAGLPVAQAYHGVVLERGTGRLNAERGRGPEDGGPEVA